MPYVFNPFTGTFDWTAPAGASAVPTFLASGSTYSVAENTQAVFAQAIDIEGFVDCEGFLVEV